MKIFCFAHDTSFDIEDAIYTVITSDGEFVGCPVCAAHGDRVLHLRNDLLWVKDEPATAGTVPVGEGLLK